MKYLYFLQKKLPLGLLFLLNLSLFAQATPSTKEASYNLADIILDSNFLLLIIAICLLLPIYMLGRIFIMSVQMHNEKEKNTSKLPNIWFVAVVLLGLSAPVSAQDAAAAATVASTAASGGVVSLDTIRYILISTIFLEAIIIMFFAFKIIRLLNPKTSSSPEAITTNTGKSRLVQWWEKINSLRPIEEEASLDTGHSYDGIRELNNATPTWFTFAFGLSILFAIVYLWRYHVAESAPLQLEEFAIEMAAAEEAKAEYLKKQANLVDESNVKMLGDADIALGQKAFVTHCAACHAANGASMPGGVGPNLTDDYWLHGNKIQDVFKTIKYGYPDKGMKSWKDDFSPNQIAQLASYIHHITGTNIAGGKEAQGEKASSDALQITDTTSTQQATDSLSH